MATNKRLTPRDWADAALTALAEGGPAAVAVEPIAARLGTTKGSFYWHFRNRDALLDAALKRWTERHTEAVIRELERAEPARRLDLLFDTVFADGPGHRAELALLGHADHPAVAAALAGATNRRVDVVVGCLIDLGLPPERARHQGLLAYTAYLGLIQAQRASGGTLLPDAERPAYLAYLRAALFR